MSDPQQLFRERVVALVDQVRAWAETHEWVTKPYPKRFRDEAGHVFEVPALFLQQGPTRVLLDPVAYDPPVYDCLVDLYLMPTYDDLASLILTNGTWTVRYSPDGDPCDAPDVPLSEAEIARVLESIASHATATI